MSWKQNCILEKLKEIGGLCPCLQYSDTSLGTCQLSPHVQLLCDPKCSEINVIQK